MNRKLLWLIPGLLMAALVLASCTSATTEPTAATTVTGQTTQSTSTTTTTPAATTTAPATTTTTTAPAAAAGPVMITDAIGRLVEKPQYGGTITYLARRGTTIWHALGSAATTNDFVFEGMAFWDFTRGPSGTGELAMSGAGGGGRINRSTAASDWVGGVIESWEQPSDDEAFLHVREGVRWQDGPLLGGREVVAADIVYSIMAVQDFSLSLLYTAPGDPGYVATVVDKYTVKIELEAPKLRRFGSLFAYVMIVPPEVEGTGLNWNDWHSSVGTGTGPYILQDVVEGSSFLQVRNPNYWRDHPMYPGDKLPYPDSMKGLTITDLSTQMAALRTGKIDYMGYVPWAQKPSLIRTSPDLVFMSQPGFDYHIYLRQDRGVFTDRNVRWAMNMAVDPDAIIRDLYGGDAEWWNFPLNPFCTGQFTALEDMPADIQEIYTYNPAKAKELLTAAGYPNGFKIETIAMQEMVDILSIYQQYFAEVGIEFTIKVVESGSFWNIAGQKEWEVISSNHGTGCAQGGGGIFTLLADGNHFWNYSVVTDDYMQGVIENLPDVDTDPDDYDSQIKDLGIYWAREAKYMNLPATTDFKFWQPWLKGQSGEYYIGSGSGYLSSMIYGWVDQDLKERMTGSR